MKYISIDLETTGSNDDVHQVIEIGAVVDDLEEQKPIDELPEFHTYVGHDTYNVSEYCLGMHSDTGIFEKLSSYGDGQSDNIAGIGEAVIGLNTFIRDELELTGWPGESRGSLNVCCHNFTVFDFRFLRRAMDDHFGKASRESTVWDVNRIRPFDPCQFYMQPDDDKVPGTRTAMKRSDMEPSVAHTAVADAKDMIRMTRRHFG